MMITESQKKIILLVEDDALDAELITREINKSDADLEVVWQSSGAQALSWLEEQKAKKPVVVILDLNMPGMGGIEVLRRVRSSEPTEHLPVVVLSSSGEPSDIEACYTLGVNSYVAKPVDLRQFRSSIHSISLFWGGINCSSTRQVLIK